MPTAWDVPTFSGPEAPSGIQSQQGGSFSQLIPTEPARAEAPAPTQIDKTNWAPSTGSGSTPIIAAPVLSTLNPEQETVSGQLRTLLATGNPLMEQSRNRAITYAADRGMQNASLAAQAGEQAFISQALPIASQDAQTYAQRSLFNTQTRNQFGLQERGFQQQQELSAKNFDYSRALQAEAAMQAMQQAAMMGDINSRLALEQAGYNFQLSAAENAYRLQQQAAAGNINAQLALQQFTQNTELQSQQGRIQAERDAAQFGYNTQLQAQQAADRLIELARQGDINSRLQLEQFGFNTQLSAQENLARLQQLAAQGDQTARLNMQQYTFNSALQAQQAGEQMTLADRNFQLNSQLITQQFNDALHMDQRNYEQQMVLNQQNHTQTLDRIRMEADAQAQLSQTTQSYSAGVNLQTQYLTSVMQRQTQAGVEIQSIYQQQGLTAEQQQYAVGVAYDRMQADIQLMQSQYQASPLWDTSYRFPTVSTPTPPAAPAPAAPAPAATPSFSWVQNPYGEWTQEYQNSTAEQWGWQQNPYTGEWEQVFQG